jgi:hypothetical protein
LLEGTGGAAALADAPLKLQRALERAWGAWGGTPDAGIAHEAYVEHHLRLYLELLWPDIAAHVGAYLPTDDAVVDPVPEAAQSVADADSQSPRTPMYIVTDRGTVRPFADGRDDAAMTRIFAPVARRDPKLAQWLVDAIERDWYVDSCDVVVGVTSSRGVRGVDDNLRGCSSPTPPAAEAVPPGRRGGRPGSATAPSTGAHDIVSMLVAAAAKRPPPAAATHFAGQSDTAHLLLMDARATNAQMALSRLERAFADARLGGADATVTDAAFANLLKKRAQVARRERVVSFRSFCRSLLELADTWALQLAAFASAGAAATVPSVTTPGTPPQADGCGTLIPSVRVCHFCHRGAHAVPGHDGRPRVDCPCSGWYTADVAAASEGSTSIAGLDRQRALDARRVRAVLWFLDCVVVAPPRADVGDACGIEKACGEASPNNPAEQSPVPAPPLRWRDVAALTRQRAAHFAKLKV